MNSGDIVLAVIPQDGMQKRRPVLILQRTPRYNDLLVCAISSRLHQFIEGLDIMLEDNHDAFPKTGLSTSSVFRVTNVAKLAEEDIEGIIGNLRSDLHQQIVDNLSRFLNAGVNHNG